MSGPAQFGDCDVLSRVDSGRVADLFHAVQQPLGRHVFVKALSPSILPSSPFAAALEREARVLAELDDPHLPRLFAYHQKADRMWLVLQYIDGWPLSTLLEKVGALGTAAATQIAVEVASALAHLHERGIIHRDVRPANIWVAKSGQVQLVNLSGAASKIAEAGPELLDGNHAFDIGYLSPEQVLGEPPDPRSDLFSLGVVLYELLSGRSPFGEASGQPPTHRIRHDSALPLSRAAQAVSSDGAATISSGLERLVHRALQKLPSDRFASAAEMVRALQQLRAGEGGDNPVRDRLAEAELVPPSESTAAPATPRPPRLARDPLRMTLAQLGIFCVLLAAGGVAIYEVAGSHDLIAQTPGRAGRLELAPADPSYLRIVADPWARVIVDGQDIDTTPMARAIPVRAGTHYLRFEHPNAATVHRTVNVVAGETALIDVKMNVPEAAYLPTRANATTDAGTDAAPASP